MEPRPSSGVAAVVVTVAGLLTFRSSVVGLEAASTAGILSTVSGTSTVTGPVTTVLVGCGRRDCTLEYFEGRGKEYKIIAALGRTPLSLLIFHSHRDIPNDFFRRVLSQ